MSVITIELPLPHKNLSPNSRCHWRAKAAATAKARGDSRNATCDQINRKHSSWDWPAATVQATFYFRDKRKHDKDNSLSSLKAYFDGLADAGLITNDSGLTHLPVVHAVDKLNPRVVLTITKTTPECER